MNCLVKYALAAAIPLTLASTAARAEINICNDFRAPISVALAADEGATVHAVGWWSVDPQDCKSVGFPFQGAKLYYTADSEPYRSSGQTARDHWGNKRAFFVPMRAFDQGEAEVQQRGTRMKMFSEATVAEQLRGRALDVTLRFSPGSTSVSMKSK